MLENIRKYTVFMAVVVVFLFIGLVFMGAGDNGFGNMLGGPPVFKADGKGYTQTDAVKLGQNGIRLSKEMGLDGQNYLYSIGEMDANGGDFKVASFAIRRTHLQELADEMGIHPSKEQIEDYIQTKSVFAPEGKFNQAAYQNYIDNRLPNMGMDVKDFNAFMGELVTYKKMTEILSSGISIDRTASDELFANMRQEIAYRFFNFPRSKQEATIEPTEDEVKAHWELNKAKYKTSPQAKLTYILGKANIPNAPSPPATDAEQSAEQKALAEKASARLSAINEINEKFDLLWDNLHDLDGNEFENYATEAGYTPVVTELFPIYTLPKAINKEVKDAGEFSVAKAIQKLIPGSGTMESISDVYQLVDNSFLLFRLDEYLDAEVMTFDQAKAEARLDYINERAAIEMKAAADKAHAELAKLIADGKSIDEAAAALKLEPKKLGPLSIYDEPQGVDGARGLFQLASQTNTNQLSKVSVQNDARSGISRAAFVYVDSRILRDSEQNAAIKDMQYGQINQALPRYVIDNWISERYNASNPEL